MVKLCYCLNSVVNMATCFWQVIEVSTCPLTHKIVGNLAWDYYNQINFGANSIAEHLEST